MKIYKKSEVRDIILAFLAFSVVLAYALTLKNHQSKQTISQKTIANEVILCHQKERGFIPTEKNVSSLD